MTTQIVPEGTKRIPRHQFKNLEMEEIILPEGLEWIGAHCFRNSRLRRIVIPSTVTRIDFGAFSACDNLEEVVLPEGIRYIDRRAFSECESLKTVYNLPESGVGECAFYEYRLSRHCCPCCGAPLNKEELCSANCNNPYGWIGSLRLYKGLFWWNGNELITVKVHCMPTGMPAYSVRFFGKRDQLGSHGEEWEILKQSGDSRIKGIQEYNDIPCGRVEITNFEAGIFLHPDLNCPKIMKKIKNEFGLNENSGELREIRIIADESAQYRTKMPHEKD